MSVLIRFSDLPLTDIVVQFIVIDLTLNEIEDNAAKQQGDGIIDHLIAVIVGNDLTGIAVEEDKHTIADHITDSDIVSGIAPFPLSIEFFRDGSEWEEIDAAGVE